MSSFLACLINMRGFEGNDGVFADILLHWDGAEAMADGQWQSYQKSLLIHSILGDYLIPPIYLVKYKEADETYYEALDGKQRVTSIFEFIEGQYQLHASTPSVMIDGEEYELANKSFVEEGEVEATEESMTCLNNNESQREYYFVVK